MKTDLAYKLVPVVPNDAMHEAAAQAWNGALSDYWTREMWAAMLAAAPEPPLTDAGREALAKLLKACQPFMKHDGLCARIGGYGYCSCGVEAVDDAINAALAATPTIAEAPAHKGVETAARALLDKLDAVHADPRYESVWTVNQAHCGPYDGLTYTGEVAALRDAIAAHKDDPCDGRSRHPEQFAKNAKNSVAETAPCMGSVTRNENAVDGMRWCLPSGRYCFYATSPRCQFPATPDEAAIRAENVRPMNEAPRDGTVILGITRNDLPKTEGGWSADRWNGRCVPMRHEGQTVSDFDLGWSVALPVGYGGLLDEWFAGWIPLPAALATPDLNQGRAE